MATYQQVGMDAASVNAAFGNWIQFRGAPKVPPIAQTSGVSYTPAQNTLYKDFGDAFKSLPDLLKGARGTYEAYWEQAKKSADDYRAGKSLSEINKELDNNDVKLQYRPLLMSALEFRQGQESQQIVAQELTTRINSGEFADLSPIELDEAITGFINDQLGGLQESYGASGGTDAFYNGYYSQVARTREFAQRRNDELVEQRRKQDVEIQTKAALNEMSQIEGITIEDIQAGIAGLKDTFNFSPLDEITAYETVLTALASNPNGVELINAMRSMSYGTEGQTLEDIFTKAYFDGAQIDAANTLFKADAERFSAKILELDRLARQGAVGRLKSELNAALIKSGNLETQEVQYARNALLQGQHEAERQAKAKAAQSNLLAATIKASGGYGSTREVRENFSSDREATDHLYSIFSNGFNNIVNDPNPESRAAKTNDFYRVVNNFLESDYNGIATKAIRESFPTLDKLLKLTTADEDVIRKNPELMFQVVSGVNREFNPNEYNRRLSMASNEVELFKALSENTLVSQSILGDAVKYGGHPVLAFALQGDTLEEIGLNLINSKRNYENNRSSKALEAVADRLGTDVIDGDLIAMRLATTSNTLDQIEDSDRQREAQRWAASMVDYINPEGRNLIGTPLYSIPKVPKEYLDYTRNSLMEINALLPTDKQWDMNLVKREDVADLIGFFVMDRVGSSLRTTYEYATEQSLPHAWGATHADINQLLNTSEWQVSVTYNSAAGAYGDLNIAIVDSNGRPINYDFNSFLALDSFLEDYRNNPDKFNNALEAATGKTFEQIKKKQSIDDILRENKPKGLGGTMETISGYEAGKLKGTGGLRLENR